jgi:uncharacterized protein (TIGR02646 family)
MKHIQKRGCPHEYAAWCSRVKGTDKEDYREMPKDTRGALLAGLVAEQGCLCAYTMKRIAVETSHVEHIKPESLCRAERVGSDLDYGNMVACFPREGMERRYRYGAQRKDNWWAKDGADFVSPLDRNCETRFRFDLEGNIAAVGVAASTTVQVLRLDHPSLTEERRRVIEEFVYGENGDSPLTEAKAKRAIQDICKLDGADRFYEFCVAIRDALGEHVKSLKKLAQKRKFARRK